MFLITLLFGDKCWNCWIEFIYLRATSYFRTPGWAWSCRTTRTSGWEGSSRKTREEGKLQQGPPIDLRPRISSQYPPLRSWLFSTTTKKKLIRPLNHPSQNCTSFPTTLNRFCFLSLFLLSGTRKSMTWLDACLCTWNATSITYQGLMIDAQELFHHQDHQHYRFPIKARITSPLHVKENVLCQKNERSNWAQKNSNHHLLLLVAAGYNRDIFSRCFNHDFFFFFEFARSTCHEEPRHVHEEETKSFQALRGIVNTESEKMYRLNYVTTVIRLDFSRYASSLLCRPVNRSSDRYYLFFNHVVVSASGSTFSATPLYLFFFFFFFFLISWKCWR